VRRDIARVATIAGYWTRHEVTLERAAALLGLAAVAVAQPVFEVVSKSPEFFAARGTTAATAVPPTRSGPSCLTLAFCGCTSCCRRISKSNCHR
jgi:hypothetical protein